MHILIFLISDYADLYKFFLIFKINSKHPSSCPSVQATRSKLHEFACSLMSTQTLCTEGKWPAMQECGLTRLSLETSSTNSPMWDSCYRTASHKYSCSPQGCLLYEQRTSSLKLPHALLPYSICISQCVYISLYIYLLFYNLCFHVHSPVIYIFPKLLHGLSFINSRYSLFVQNANHTWCFVPW